MLTADSTWMNSGTLIISDTTRFDDVGSHEPLAGRAVMLLVVLSLHAALVIWVLHLRQDTSEYIEPIRVSVRMIEVSVPAPPVAVAEPVPEPVAELVSGPVPEPVMTPPKPSPKVIHARAPVQQPARTAARKVEPQQPMMTAPPQQPVVEDHIKLSTAPRSVIAVRYDVDYLNNPAPVYPILSRRRGEQGKVLLLVQVSAQGLAEKVEIHESSGHLRLDSAALEAVKRWRFVPARRGDEAVAASVVVPILFRLGS